MIVPPQLQQGDTVGIVAPARKISPAQTDPAIVVLTSWGLNPRLGKNIFSSAHSYLAGTDQQRLDDFQSMINDPDVKAIFCARGGYGSTRIIDDLDFSPLKHNPKWIVGFSDVTAFHLRLLGIGVAAMHATMPIFFGREEAQASVESIRKILFDGSCDIELATHESSRLGRAAGEVVGGNLSLIVDSLNTPSEPDTAGKILVLEEVDEYFYKIDRMFTQLRRAGKLKDLAGLIIGHMTDIKNSDLDFGETIQEIVTHAVRDYQFPVAFDFPSGHENPNMAWIEGGVATLDVNAENTSLRYSNIYRANE
jgi:muramoyltetrapeptide carboxypeptidase